jgi:hypothetical protein
MAGENLNCAFLGGDVQGLVIEFDDDSYCSGSILLKIKDVPVLLFTFELDDMGVNSCMISTTNNTYTLIESGGF